VEVAVPLAGFVSYDLSEIALQPGRLGKAANLCSDILDYCGLLKQLRASTKEKM
jgi:hypothetical protein